MPPEFPRRAARLGMTPVATPSISEVLVLDRAMSAGALRDSLMSVKRGSLCRFFGSMAMRGAHFSAADYARRRSR